MITVTVKVDAPLGQALAVKECLAMELERFGDVRGCMVREEWPEQRRLEGTR